MSRRDAETQSCSWEEQVALLAGGDLSAAEAVEVQEHVKDCAACGVLLEELAELRGGLEELSAVEEWAVAELRAQVLERIGARRSWWRWAAVAAVVVMAVGLGWMAGLDTREVEGLTLADLRGLGAPGAPEVKRVETVERVMVARREPEDAAHSSETLNMAMAGPGMLEIQTEDPDVVIYWILEGAGD